MKLFSKAKVQRSRTQTHARRPRYFGHQTELDPFIWLNPNGQPIRAQRPVTRRKDVVRNLSELYDDFGPVASEPLSGAQIERDASPAPVCDFAFIATNVSVELGLSARPISSLYPGTCTPSATPARYCPRTVWVETSVVVNGRSARNTFRFSSRIASGSNSDGGSIVVKQRSWSRWF